MMRAAMLRRTAVAVGLFAAVVITVSACGSSGSGSSSGGGEADKPVNVALFVSSLANTYAQAEHEGVEAAAKKIGNVHVQTFAAEFDPNKQVQQIETAAATGQYDAFIVPSLDGVRVIPAIKQAIAEGITVVCSFSVCGPNQDEFANEIEGLASQTGVNAGVMGEQTGEAVNDACAGKDPCNLVIMYGLAQLVSEKWWAREMEAVLDPSIKVIATGEGQFLAETSYKAFKDILQAHPEVDAVVAPGDQMIVGSQQALEEAGTAGNVALIGTGASESADQQIAAGKWFGSHVLRPYHDGLVATETAVKAARGEHVPPLIDTLKTSVIPGGVVTKENVSEWKPEWAG